MSLNLLVLVCSNTLASVCRKALYETVQAPHNVYIKQMTHVEKTVVLAGMLNLVCCYSNFAGRGEVINWCV